MSNYFLKLTIIPTLVLLISSCAGRKAYQRPAVVDERLFRTENISTDSLNSASLSWKEIFTDLTLQKHIQKALASNLDIRMALQNIASSQAYLKQSQSAFFPVLSSGVNYTRSTQSLNANNFSSSRAYNNLWDLTLTASWEADVWGKINARNKANYASFLMNVSAHKAVTSQIVATLATAYYQLLMLDKQKDILQKTISLRRESLLTTQELKNAGITTEVAVQQSQALLYNAQSQLVSIENSVWALENTICVLLGEEPHEIQRTTLDSQSFPNHFKQGYPVQLLENRPDVQKAEQQLRNAFEMTNVARTAFYPSFSLSARGGFSSNDLEKWLSVQSIFANFLAGLTQPIFNQRQIRTQYEVSKIQQETALLNFKKTLLTAGKEVSDAMFHLDNQQQIIQLKTKELEAYQKATQYSKELFNSAMANYLEVITAEVNRLNAELSLANAQFAKMQYGIALYKALGGGWR